MIRKSKLLALSVTSILCLFARLALCAKPKPHYVYVLPSGYIGWIRIIHNDRDAQHRPTAKDGSVRIELDENGEARDSDMTFHLDLVGGPDQFLYRAVSSSGVESYTAVPAEYIVANSLCSHPTDKPSCYNSLHGGFTTMNLDDIPGSSVYFFIGPPDRRPAYYGVTPTHKCTWQSGEKPPRAGRLTEGEAAQPWVCSLPNRIEH